jgi:Protein of unknown function (DUF3830)
MRKIILELEGANAIAALFDEHVPRTVEALWNLLPISGKAIHANWSGREIMLHLEGEKLLRPPQEVKIHSNFIREGDIHFFYRSASLSRGKQLAYSAQFQKELSELAIFYGSPSGEMLAAYDPARTPYENGIHVLAKIGSLITPIPEYFKKKCESVRREGIKPLTVSRLMDT